MEALKIGEVAVLEDGKEYIVFNQTELEGNNYVYLLSNFKPVEVKFAKQLINGEDVILSIVTDVELRRKLLTLLESKKN